MVVLVVAVAQVAVVVTAQVVVAVVMAQAHVLNRVLAVVVLVVEAAQAIISKRAQLIHVLLTHVQHAQRIHVLRVLLTHVQHVQQVVHGLLNQRLAANVKTLAVAKNDSPKSSPFCMESSRFR